MDSVTQQWRDLNAALRASTTRDLIKLWPLLDFKRLDATFPGWVQASAALIDRNHGLSAELAAEYLRRSRTAIIGTPGDVSLAAKLDSKRLEAVLSIVAVARFKQGLMSGYTANKAAQHALVSTTGAAQRLVEEGARRTVADTSVADPAARGWARGVRSDACGFCRGLAGRAGVYTDETASFGAHDHCTCYAFPVWDSPQQVPVAKYQPTTRNITDAQRKRTREWAKSNAVA